MIETFDKDIPPPKATAPWRRKVAWEKMQIGDSFVHECDHNSQAHNLCHHAKRKFGYRFRVCKVAEGQYRIWRVG